LCRRFSLLKGQTPELLLLLARFDRLLLLLLLAVLLPRCFCFGAAELHLSAATGLPSKHVAASKLLLLLLLLLASDGLCPAEWTNTTNDMSKQQQQILCSITRAPSPHANERPT
jgi:hypothetical protein